MLTSKLIVLIATFFFTSVISVVTGSTSLITVPVMIQIGIEPHAAVATNMMALTFMSAGGALPFVGKRVLVRRVLPASIVLTVIGSALGALLLLEMSARALELVIALAMAALAIFSVARRDFGKQEAMTASSWKRELSAYAATFALAVYGGLFSGGYVTLLTSAFVVLFGMTLLQSVANTKVVNIFSSAAATLVFLRRGIVEWKLGIVLGITMFVGAMIGGHVTLRLSSTWIRRIFIASVLGLAVKMAWSAFHR